MNAAGPRPRVTVVTGSAGGIGHALVARFREGGDHVIGVDVAEAPDDDTGRPDTTVEADVSTAEGWEAVVHTVEKVGSGLATLVNCAGIGGRTDLLGTSLADWDRVLGVNLTGTWLGMKTCHHLLADRAAYEGDAAIVNFGSIYGQLPPPVEGNTPSSPAYQASKAGILALTKTAASEWAADGIRVNAVAPGLFRTHLTESLSEEAYAARMRPIAMRRDGDTRELADVVWFLAGPESSYVTGTTVNVDGGFPLWL
ncbi:SDR family NAD(P)-dependent oxidoreductase [Brevibacterium litoralis]|uniref:SDR family NAD(P)-dependent oxidoreductase n=1 Tax=Brevibacterium litoralis TaxID=3138935 RepID=UPI0032EE5485